MTVLRKGSSVALGKSERKKQFLELKGLMGGVGQSELSVKRLVSWIPHRNVKQVE